MAIDEVVNERLKEAMKARKNDELMVLRAIKTRFQQKKTEEGFSGEFTDDIAREVISTYVKQMKKAVEEYEKTGPQGAQKAAELRFEVEYLSGFLPRMMSEAETADLVGKKIAELGIADAKQIGKLVGAIMKDFKGKVDAALVKKIATEKLS